MYEGQTGQRQTGRSRTSAPGCERSLRRQRRRVFALVALSLALLLEASPRPDGEEEPGAGLTPATLGAAAVEKVIEGANPGISERSRARIAAAVVRYSALYDLDPELVTAVLLVESGARPWAHSPKGAVGLMQVMPHMILPLDLAGNAATIESNVEAGCRILAENIHRLGEEEGILAYFWGSNIRGVAYLERVRAARAEVRKQQAS